MLANVYLNMFNFCQMLANFDSPHPQPRPLPTPPTHTPPSGTKKTPGNVAGAEARRGAGVRERDPRALRLGLEELEDVDQRAVAHGPAKTP